jgi:hypothetical protein
MLGYLFSSFAIDNSLSTVVIFSLAGLDTSLWALPRCFDRLPCTPTTGLVAENVFCLLGRPAGCTSIRASSKHFGAA